MQSQVQNRATHVRIDHPDRYLACGIRALLRAHGNYEVSVCCDPAGEVAHPDLVLIDYDTLFSAGFILQRQAQAQAQAKGYARGRPQPRVMVVADRCTSWQVRKAIDAGVMSYLTENCSAEEMLAALRTVALGQRYFPVAVAQQLADSLAIHAPTHRELAVLNLLADGLNNRAISQQLSIGEGTVKTHVKALFNKLQVPSRTAAVAAAQRLGMLSRAAGGMAMGAGRSLAA